jgi:hypothetical protein
MKDKVNFYFAMLIMFITGACAAWLIIHVANQNNLGATLNGSESNYSGLQQSILKN